MEDQLQTISIMKWMTQFPIGLRNVHIVRTKVTIEQIVAIDNNISM